MGASDPADDSADGPPFLFVRDRCDVEAGEARGLGVMAIICDLQGRVLLHLRDDKPGIWYPGHWAIFGGAMEPGEQPLEALAREIREELGFLLEDPQPFCRVFDRDGSRQVVTIYVATQALDPVTITLGEGVAARFFDEAETSRLKITPFLHAALKVWFRER